MMNRKLMTILLLAACCGCMTKAPTPHIVRQVDANGRSESRAETSRGRAFTDKQLDALRSFALSESPVLWQTVQALKVEKASRKAGIEKLCKEMREFGRNPDVDPDVAVLKQSYEDLEVSLNTIYAKLEDAYIAYKKMQATPGRREYADMMKLALEDGIQEADAAVAKYRTMSKEK